MYPSASWNSTKIVSSSALICCSVNNSEANQSPSTFRFVFAGNTFSLPSNYGTITLTLPKTRSAWGPALGTDLQQEEQPHPEKYRLVNYISKHLRVGGERQESSLSGSPLLAVVSSRPPVFVSNAAPPQPLAAVDSCPPSSWLGALIASSLFAIVPIMKTVSRSWAMSA